MKKRYNRFTINTHKTIKQALLSMNINNKKVLVLSDHGEYSGVVSIGDIQRALLNDNSLDTPLCAICRPASETTFKFVGDSMAVIKARMVKDRIELMPIVDEAMNLHDIIIWEEFFEGSIAPSKMAIQVPVVVMAGGLGTRLKPLTNIIPKALVPVFEKPIVQDIIDRLNEQGATRFFLTVNYKSDMIENYFRDLGELPYSIEYLHETVARGTAGSLNLLAGKINETFIVTNCDIILDQDYSDILDYHQSSRNDITVVGAIKNFDVPYGVLHTRKGGALSRIEEKPEKSYLVNTGFYVLEPQVLNEIPKDDFFHMTHLIEKVLDRGGKVGVFPVNESSWLDMGDWYEFDKMRGKLLKSRTYN